MKRLTVTIVLLASVVLASCGQPASSSEHLRIGAIYPLTGPEMAGGQEEWRGVQLAASLMNEQGGWQGKQIDLVLRDSPSPEAAAAAANSLTKDEHLPLVLGAHGSTIALQAANAVLSQGDVYWETGAVASDLLDFHDPHFFRMGVDGSMLGAGSARFTAEILAPKLGLSAPRIAVLNVDDIYGKSVANGAIDEAHRRGLNVVGQVTYPPNAPDYPRMIAAIQQLKPDILFVASYLGDGVAFRRAAIAAHLHVRAMVGTSSAFCLPAFGEMLGQQAVGLYASDKPGPTINPQALTPAAAQLLTTVRQAYQQKYGVQPGAAALAGFVSAWVLFHDVLPRLHAVTPDTVSAAARTLDFPEGSEITGAGVRFAPSGQNLRPASIIWEWQGVRQIEPVYPPIYAARPPVILPIDQ